MEANTKFKKGLDSKDGIHLQACEFKQDLDAGVSMLTPIHKSQLLKVVLFLQNLGYVSLVMRIMSTKRKNDNLRREIGGDQPATPRHTSRLLQLLPSGPGWVNNLSLRGDQKVTIDDAHYL